MNFVETLLDVLKNRYIETAGMHEFGGVASKTQYPYYLKHLGDNLVVAMGERHIAEYSQGSGGELDGKMKSLRSSSAMTFNLFGNGPVKLNGENYLPPGTYNVEFEHQLPTLARNPHPANLDAKLESEDAETVIYCEMKLSEWILNKAGGLRPQYLETESYLISKTHAAVFCEAFESLCEVEADRSGRLSPKLKRYDAFQMLKHLLAIYTEANRKVEAGVALPKRTVLLNCVWEMENPEKLGRYEAKYRSIEADEHAQYCEFAETVKPIVELFSELGIEFAIRYLSFSKMRESLELEAAHWKALDRYIV